MGTEAFLIREGQCSIQSKKNPLNAIKDDVFAPKNIDIVLRTKRGFLSNTTNTFQFGTIDKNQWAGEERILKINEEPIEYSVIALTKVVAFVISKEEAKKRMPKEFMVYLMGVVKQKIKWLEERKQALTSSAKAVANMDPSKERYDHRLTEVVRKFPSASSPAIASIRKGQVLNKIQTELSMYKQLADMKRNKEKIQTSRTQNVSISTVKEELKNLSIAFRNPMHNNYIANAVTLPSIIPYKLSSATSSPRGIFCNELVPTIQKSRITKLVITKIGKHDKSLLAKTQMIFAKNKALPSAMLQLMMKKELSQFEIGSRSIAMLTESNGTKPSTPNPFAIINPLKRK